MNYIELIDMLDEVNDSLVIIIVIFMINIIQLTGHHTQPLWSRNFRMLEGSSLEKPTWMSLPWGTR